MKILILPGSNHSPGIGRAIAEACGHSPVEGQSIAVGDAWFHVYKVGKNRIVGWLL